MQIIRKIVKADGDGIIHLDLNVVPNLEYDVVLVYHPLPIGTRSAVAVDPEERIKILTEAMGSWQGDFVQDRTVFEEREPT